MNEAMKELATEATELARLDRAAKTATDNLRVAKEKITAMMDEYGVTSVPTSSGKATVTLVDSERLVVDGEALSETDLETYLNIRTYSVDLKKFRAMISAGVLSEATANKVSTIKPVRSVRVSRK
jgi:hypothetical protein